MLPIKEWSISMWTAGLVRQFVQSTPSFVSLECPRCGFVFAAQRADGTSSFTYAIRCFQQKSSAFNLCLALTADGKLLISCACSQSDAKESEAIGRTDTISSTRTSSRPVPQTTVSVGRLTLDKSARPCGCDPGARHICDEHLAELHGSGLAGDHDDD